LKVQNAFLPTIHRSNRCTWVGVVTVISTLSRNVAVFISSAVLLSPLFAAEPAKAVLERDFTQTVKPFITQYCAGCHSGKSPAAQLDLTAYATLSSVVQDFAHWNLLMERMERQEMPPKPMAQPPADRRQKVIEWVKAVRADELRRIPESARDPSGYGRAIRIRDRICGMSRWMCE